MQTISGLSIQSIKEKALKFSDKDGNCFVVSNSDGTIGRAISCPAELQVSFENAKNMIIVIFEGTRFLNCRVKAINSDNSLLCIGHSTRKIANLEIFFKFSNHNHCIIGEGFSCGDVQIMVSEKANVTIGDDCMFSDNVKIWNFDGHAILDKNGKCINHAKDIIIGKHVWLGMDATVSKGAIIADGSVVGQKSLVTSQFLEPMSILAGIPAKQIANNIVWKRNPPSDFQ